MRRMSTAIRNKPKIRGLTLFCVLVCCCISVCKAQVSISGLIRDAQLKLAAKSAFSSAQQHAVSVASIAAAAAASSAGGVPSLSSADLGQPAAIHASSSGGDALETRRVCVKTMAGTRCYDPLASLRPWSSSGAAGPATPATPHVPASSTTGDSRLARPAGGALASAWASLTTAVAAGAHRSSAVYRDGARDTSHHHQHHLRAGPRVSWKERLIDVLEMLSAEEQRQAAPVNYYTTITCPQTSQSCNVCVNLVNELDPHQPPLSCACQTCNAGMGGRASGGAGGPGGDGGDNNGNGDGQVNSGNSQLGRKGGNVTDASTNGNNSNGQGGSSPGGSATAGAGGSCTLTL